MVDCHDTLVRWLHHYLTKDLHIPCWLEQCLNPSKEKEEDRLDLIVNLNATTINMDIAIAGALTTSPHTRQARARHDGHAAHEAACRKRRRYRRHNVLPFIIEDYGRPGKDTIQFVRTITPPSHHPKPQTISGNPSRP